MVQVRIKRVYEDFSETDGYRVLVDKLWPRGIKKEWLKYDYWAKDITPSAPPAQVVSRRYTGALE